MTSDQPVRLVQERQALHTVIEAIEAEDCIAFDTEFHSERRYYPELMLAQVGTRDGRTWVVDPQAVDIGPLFRALAQTELLVHSGSQDLLLLLREGNEAATRVFDIQLAAGLCGYGHPTRLDDLVRNVIGGRLDKGPTLSDWAKRPLSPTQIAYAASDVKVLFDLRDALTSTLEAENRLQWAEEECQQLVETVAAGPTVKHAWTGWEIVSRLDAGTQNILGVLFHWRDQQGRNKNQPPYFILSDGLCLDIARRRPRTVDALTENRRIPQGLVRRLGKEIVGIVDWACDNQAELPFIPTAEEQQRAQALNLWARAKGQSLGVAPSLLLTPEASLHVARSGTSALSGWRAAVLGEDLDTFLKGESGLYISPTGPEIR